MLTSEMKDTVVKQRLGFVATVTAAGQPSVSPKGTFVVVDDRTLAFGAIRSPGTVANLRRQPAVEVNFVDALSRKGFRAMGAATVHSRDDDVYRPSRFDRWGALADGIELIVLNEIRSAKPILSPAYDIGALECDLRAQWTAILIER